MSWKYPAITNVTSTMKRKMIVMMRAIKVGSCPGLLRFGASKTATTRIEEEDMTDWNGFFIYRDDGDFNAHFLNNYCHYRRKTVWNYERKEWMNDKSKFSVFDALNRWQTQTPPPPLPIVQTRPCAAFFTLLKSHFVVVVCLGNDRLHFHRIKK